MAAAKKMFGTSSYYRVNCESMKSSRVFVVKFVDEKKNLLLKKSLMIFSVALMGRKKSGAVDYGVVRWICCDYGEGIVDQKSIGRKSYVIEKLSRLHLRMKERLPSMKIE